MFKNGTTKFLYHETNMMIPIANAIFDSKININDFIKYKKKQKTEFTRLDFQDIDENKFPAVKLIPFLNKYTSTPIIINAANEILVDQFLKKKIPFNSFYKYIMMVLKDKNYKKYAIKEPKKVSEIFQIDQWSRNITYQKLNNDKHA